MAAHIMNFLKIFEKNAPSLASWAKKCLKAMKDLPDIFDENAPLAVPATLVSILLLILFIFLMLMG
jgi:hypothetical protein